MRQSADSAFITYHPSINPDWEYTLKLAYPGGEYAVTPTIRSNEGVFEFGFSDSDIESGRYNWILEITPPDSYTIEIGTFNEELIAVRPTNEDSFPSREEAMENVGSISNTSATPVQFSQNTYGDDIMFSSSGHGGGSGSDTRGRFITRDVSVEAARSAYSFGADSNLQFRITNVTTESSLTFTPG